MRRVSIGAMISFLLAAGLLLWGPLSQDAAAQAGITVGYAIDKNGLGVSSRQVDQLGSYLEKRLAMPIKVRSFANEDQLYVWLTRYREVDIAWLSQEMLATVPSGQLYPLASAMTGNTEADGMLPRGTIVARHDLDVALMQQAQAALVRMHETAEGESLLAQLALTSFAEPAGIVSRTAPAMARPSGQLPPAASPVTVDTTAATTGTQVPDAAIVPSASAVPAVQAGDADKVSDAGAAIAEPTSDEQAPISLSADSLTYQAEDDSYEATGDVVLRQGDVELQAESLLWQAATQDAAARGKVQLRQPGTEVYGEQMLYNLATGHGKVRSGSVFVREGNFHLSGGQVEKMGETQFRVEQGNFTTCDGVVPDWKFSAEEVDVTLGGYAKARNVWFHVRDVPLLYTPYLLFPVKTERESGLLAPWFGYSSSRGARASLAWYQVIDRHMDATLYLDYLSKVGLGKGLEYRYALAGQNNGKALYYHVTGFAETPDLDYLEWEHRGTLPGGWKLTADVDYTDDELFFDEFGEVAEEYNRDKVVSTLMLQRNWEKLNVVGFARYVKDMEGSNDATLQRLPELSLALARYRVGETPIYLALESYATHFSRDAGEEGERLYLRPSVSASIKPGGWLEIVPEIALHQRVYETDAGQADKSVPEASLMLATRLVRDFDIDSWGMDRLRHSIEPRLKYTYIPDEPQDHLPSFDLYDRIEAQNTFGYEVINRLTGRSPAGDGTSTYREILNLRLAQTYDLDEARHNRSGKDQPFSDLLVELTFHPTENVFLDVDSQVPVYGDTRFSRFSASTSVRDKQGNAASLNYVYSDEDETAVASDYVGFQLDTSLFKPFYVRFEERYDFREKRELEKVFGVEYRSQCWSLFLTYRNRSLADGDEDHEVMLNFALAGLGRNRGFGDGLGWKD